MNVDSKPRVRDTAPILSRFLSVFLRHVMFEIRLNSVCSHISIERHNWRNVGTLKQLFSDFGLEA